MAAVKTAIGDNPTGDILVFLPGLREIRCGISAIPDSNSGLPTNAGTCPSSGG